MGKTTVLGDQLMASGDMKPYIPPEKSLPEITIKAIILGVILAIVLGAANVYLGLYAGMTVCASIPAAVISMAVLRGGKLRANILENNIVQTAASSVRLWLLELYSQYQPLFVWDTGQSSHTLLLR